MEKEKAKLGDLFKVEFSKEFLLKNWPRLTVLLVLLIVLIVGAVSIMIKLAQPEKLIRLELPLTKTCRRGGEVMLEQHVVREVYESQLARAPKVLKVQGLCDAHLYEMTVREEKYGRSRFYADVAQARAMIVEYTLLDEAGKSEVVKLTEDQMAHRLIKVLVDKYPEAQHYDIRVNYTHYDYNRDGVLIKKYPGISSEPIEGKREPGGH
jgi:hypothetical protein